MLLHVAFIVSSLVVALAIVATWEGWPLEDFRRLATLVRNTPAFADASDGEFAKSEGTIEVIGAAIHAPLGNVDAAAVLLRVCEAESDDPDAPFDERVVVEERAPCQLVAVDGTAIALDWELRRAWRDARYSGINREGPVSEVPAIIRDFCARNGHPLETKSGKRYEFYEAVVPLSKTVTIFGNKLPAGAAVVRADARAAYRGGRVSAERVMHATEIHTGREEILIAIGSFDFVESVQDVFLFGGDVLKWLATAAALVIACEGIFIATH